jgi:hypothetical protein
MKYTFVIVAILALLAVAVRGMAHSIHPLFFFFNGGVFFPPNRSVTMLLSNCTRLT